MITAVQSPVAGGKMAVSSSFSSSRDEVFLVEGAAGDLVAIMTGGGTCPSSS